MKDCFKDCFFFIEKDNHLYHHRIEKDNHTEIVFFNSKRLFLKTVFLEEGVSGLIVFSIRPLFLQVSGVSVFFQSFSTQRLSGIRRLFFGVGYVDLQFMSWNLSIFRAYLEYSTERRAQSREHRAEGQTRNHPGRQARILVVWDCIVPVCPYNTPMGHTQPNQKQ